jgi:hypothetical protein
VFELALALGKTVAELERDLGPDELEYWRAYYAARNFTTPSDWFKIGTMFRFALALVMPSDKRLPDLKELIPDLDFK